MKPLLDFLKGFFGAILLRVAIAAGAILIGYFIISLLFSLLFLI